MSSLSFCFIRSRVAGVSLPTADASTNFDSGWNLDLQGGFNVNPNLLADLDFSFNRSNLTKTFSTYKAGFNAGGGLEFRLGAHGLKAFAEARYSQMSRRTVLI